MKTLQLIHKEKTKECFEIIKTAIVEDKELKKFRIGKDTLLENLPEKVMNEFLDFLGTDEQFRSLMLHMIKSGTLVINCWDDEDNGSSSINTEKNRIKPSAKNKFNWDGFFDEPPSDDMPF